MLHRLRSFFFSKAFSSNKETLQGVLTNQLKPLKLVVEDESARHYEAHDSHFSVYLVSEEFQGVSRLDRYL